MIKSDETKQLFAALIDLQSELPLAQRDKSNDFDHYKYATLASVRTTCQPLLAKHKLAVFHTTATSDDEAHEIILETMLVHTSGEWIQSRMPLRAVPFPGQKDRAITPRNTGSAMTYAERYSLMAIIGMAPHADEDDDGGQGSGVRTRTQAKDAKPDLERDKIPGSPARGGARGAGRAGPSGEHRAGGAPGQEEPPPPEDPYAPPAAAKKASNAAMNRVEHFAAFLECHMGSDDAGFKMAQACSAFEGDKGETVQARSWQSLARSTKWMASTIERYNDELRGELPEYTKDWQPPADKQESAEVAAGGALPF